MILCSWTACNDKGAGHWYWVPRAWSSLDGCECLVRVSEHEVPASARLSNSFFKKSFCRLGDLAIAREAEIIRSELSIKSQTDFLIYEGGASELEVALRVLEIDASARVWFNFHYSRQWAEFLGIDENARWLRGFVTDAIRKYSGRVFLFAESNGLADLVFEKLGLEVHSFPVFTTLPNQLDIQQQSISETRNLLTCYFEDFSRLEWLARQLEQVSIHHPNVGLKVLVPARMRLNGSQIETLRKRVGTTAVIRGGYLEPGEYADILRASRIVALIYDSDQYLLHSSGKIEDILYCGALPLVPTDSLSRQNSRKLPRLDFSSDTQLVDLIREESACRIPMEPMLARQALDTLRQVSELPVISALEKAQDQLDRNWISLREKSQSLMTHAYISLIRAGFSHKTVNGLRMGLNGVLNHWKKNRRPSI